MWKAMSKISRAGLILTVVTALLLAPALAQAAQRPGSFADLADKVSKAVVNIQIVKIVKQQSFQRFYSGPRNQGEDQGDGRADPYEFFRRFFGPNLPGQQEHPRKYKQRSLGSGVIVDQDGFVLTNNHVVSGADQIKVVLNSGTEYEAEVKGRDPKTDLALIKIKTEDKLPFLPMGDSDSLRVGDWVIAVGNPFGLENTVTAGIVSAKGRAIGAGPYDDFIQTDASINPGNSGGPLIDLDGRVVGINTAIVPHGQGIGFAIPVNMVKSIMAQLKDKGKVTRGYFGVVPQELNETLAEQFGIKDAKGVLISLVTKDSPAEKGGIKRGDVIINVDDKVIAEPSDLYRVVADLKVGDEITVILIRDGKEVNLKVKVGERPDEAEATEAEPQKRADLGLTVQDVTPQIAQQLGLKEPKGVVVTNVSQGSPAGEAGISRGDVILEVGHKPVKDVNAFYSSLDGLKPGEGVLLLVQRNDITRYVVLKIPK